MSFSSGLWGASSLDAVSPRSDWRHSLRPTRAGRCDRVVGRVAGVQLVQPDSDRGPKATVGGGIHRDPTYISSLPAEYGTCYEPRAAAGGNFVQELVQLVSEYGV